MKEIRQFFVNQIKLFLDPTGGALKSSALPRLKKGMIIPDFPVAYLTADLSSNSSFERSTLHALLGEKRTILYYPLPDQNHSTNSCQDIVKIKNEIVAKR